MYLCWEASHLPLHECISHIPFIDLCSLSIGIKMHFIDIFLIGIMFDVTPYWHCFFCFRQKGGEHFFVCFDSPFIDSLFWTKRGKECFVFTWTPLLMIDKKGEKNLCMFYMHDVLETLFVLLVCHLFGIKSILFCFNWCKELVYALHLHSCLWAFIVYLLFIEMNELRGSIFEALL